MPAFDPLSRAIAMLAAMLGMGATWFYVSAGLSLSHYDAKAHLVVARRILDSLTPSWEQIGAVWLPLPHLLNALPIQIDVFYRTGASAIAISITSFAVAVACVSAIVFRVTNSRVGAAVAALLVATNRDILYLQSTPMTEPLLLALTSMVVLHLTNWALDEQIEIRPEVGWTIVLATLTRYEAWPVIATAMALAAFAKWHRGADRARVGREMLRLSIYPAAAVIGFALLSRITIGQWFVTGGFFVPDPELQGKAGAVLQTLVEGTSDLGGSALVIAAVVSAVMLLELTLRKSEAILPITFALAAAGALPFYAYFSGHPFRIRYEVPLVFACAPLIGAAVGTLGRFAPPAAVLILAAVLTQTHPFNSGAGMVEEAQLDVNNSTDRHRVTGCLQRSYDGSSIVISMGSLAHYMQELSLAGFAIKDFVHEGSGPLWTMALYRGAAVVAGWVVIEEYAEGGDVLYHRAKAAPVFLAGFDRICEGGNVALYKRR